MYLIVVITLVVAVMGVFTMGANKQAAVLIDKQQPNVAQMMMQWHIVAAAMASKWIAPGSITAIGCDLTNPAYFNPGDWPNIITAVGTSCTGHLGGSPYVQTASWAPNECSGTNFGPPQTATPCGTPLPKGWQMPPYVFYSIAFQTGVPARYFVLTFVPPAPTAGQYGGLDNLCLPGRALSTVQCPTNSILASNPSTSSRTVNGTFHGLRKQLKYAVSPRLFGTVLAAGTLTTASMGFGATAVPLTYSIPASVPVGSVGIISDFTACSTC